MAQNKALITLLTSFLLIGGLSQVTHANTHSEAYNKRVEQLKKLDNIYINKDGKVGGEFKLIDGSTARIYGVDEKGTVYVRYKGQIRPYSNQEIDKFILQNQN